MTRAERTRKAAEKVAQSGNRAAMRSTRRKDRLSRASIRDGQVAAKRFRKAQLLLKLADDRERSQANEAKKKKMARDWWRDQNVPPRADVRRVS